MKKIILFISLALVFWTCSTKLDIIDNWKETTVVYCLLDPSQDTQYVRVEKAFLGPDNALSMAQQSDSINYSNQISVDLQELSTSGVPIQTFHLIPTTVTDKNPGIFYAPDYVLYALSTPVNRVPPVDTAAFFNTTHSYKLIVTNTVSGNVVTSTTPIIKDFSITRPVGPAPINIIKTNPTTMIDVQWNGSANARLYQVAARFHYKERDVNNVITSKVAPEWVIKEITVDSMNASNAQGISFDPNAFYKFLATVIQPNSNVIARQADYIEFIVYAGGDALRTYMEVNSPSSSLVQEKPIYSNITNGLGVFSSRYQKLTVGLTLAGPTQDTLAKGHNSCQLQFLDRNESITNNLDLPPGCQ